MSRQVHFIGEIPGEDKIHLFDVISLGAKKQQGDCVEAFVSLINQNTDRILKVTFVDTCYLNRHYDPSKNKTFSSWGEDHKDMLSKLEVEYELISWESLIETQEYADFYGKIKLDFEGDEGSVPLDSSFRNLVLTYVRNNKPEKGSVRQRISYLLEEAAGYLALSDKITTYSGNLNPVVSYAKAKYSPGGVFIKHHIPDSLVKNPNADALMRGANNSFSFFAHQIARDADSLHLPTSKQQEFYDEYKGLCRRYARSLST